MAVFKSPNAPRKKKKWIKKKSIFQRIAQQTQLKENLRFNIPLTRKKNQIDVLSTNSIKNFRNNFSEYVNFHYIKNKVSRKRRTYGIRKCTVDWNYRFLWKYNTRL